VETFPLHALLGNMATQDHLDSDAAYGVAGIVTFGDFEGVSLVNGHREDMLTSISGADLVLWQLGLRMPFASGSVCMLRGHELRHATTYWNGKSRTSIVEAMTAACKRAAALKLGQPMDTESDSEQSCPGRDAV
jgi:hypothetical protein